MSKKYPSIPHLPFSPGISRFDSIGTMDGLLETSIVISEKMDGSCLCMTHNSIYARSHGGPPKHPSFDLAKAKYATIKSRIPRGISIFGEWLYAKHSIKYDTLPDYFLVFGIRDDYDDWWFSWDEVRNIANDLGLKTVPEYSRIKVYNAKALNDLVSEIAKSKGFYSQEKEGIVVRQVNGFSNARFALSIAKWVRFGHVQTDEHWMHRPIVKNDLLRGS